MSIRKTTVLLSVLAAVGAAAAVTTVHRSFRNRDTGYANGATPGFSGSSVRQPTASSPKVVRGKAPNKLNGMIDDVVDGGEVVVLDRSGEKHRVVLAHIDAPAVGQAFGPEARKFLSDLTAGKEIEVLWRQKRADGALLGEVYYRHEKFGMVDANLTMVKNGAAWRAAKDSEKAYALAEKEARTGKRGLWADANPVRPADWRRKNKAK